MMRKKELWMRPGTRVLANGKPGVVLRVVEIKDTDFVAHVDVRLDGSDETCIFGPDDLQIDRMNRFHESLVPHATPPAINQGAYHFSNPKQKGGRS